MTPDRGMITEDGVLRHLLSRFGRLKEIPEVWFHVVPVRTLECQTIAQRFFAEMAGVPIPETVAITQDPCTTETERAVAAKSASE